MATKEAIFCDWKPCSMLQKAVPLFLDPKWRPGEDIKFLVSDRASKGQLRPMYFSYCPFCGTRIRGNKDILGWVESLPKRR
jgi:hypothetical protein